jgi:hypothetical protein
MARTSIAVLIALMGLSACGGSNPGAQAPTVASVAVQPGDLPSGMKQCDLTGDIDSFLNKEKTADPTTYQSTKTEWEDAKSRGATAAYTALYTDTLDHCASIKSPATDIGSAPYKLVLNFVIQFKDESSAAKGYTSDKVFNFSASELRSSGQAVDEGTKTGLSANSIALFAPIVNQTYYIAVWQNKTFMVILAVLNIDATASKKVATSENGRIK